MGSVQEDHVMTRTLRLTLALAVIFALGTVGCGKKGTQENGGGAAHADGAGTAAHSGAAADASAAYDRGLDYLKSQRKEREFQDPGMQALAVTAFLVRPGGVRPADKEFVDATLDSIAGHQKGDGGIYLQGLANYTTCVAIMALAHSSDPKYQDTVKKAVAFVKGLQMASGGIGYEDEPGEGEGEESGEKKGEEKKSDLSHTQFALEALRAAGVPQSDPVISKALKFLQSVQNDSETNDAKYTLDDGRIVVIQDDGGAFYAPGDSKAGVENLPNGKAALRSYGSMTYALLKCYLLAGLPKDDPRVQAAVHWAESHFTLEENPGFTKPEQKMQGYFYYLMMMSKALDLLGVDQVKDADGVEHDWRQEIEKELLSRQGKDGSWKNSNGRWFEAMPLIATSYALVSLSYCMD
jgi:squalene-hopene/tetraprenyl-beta-curcumene cyclase